MRSHSKRGAALAYVIVITAALLVFAAALFSVAGANLNASQNSLESRQAYLDAKSAIEYGRAYLALYPNEDASDFSILPSDKGAGFKIKTGSVDGAIAFYNSSARTINATAKYKSSDRVRRLGYRFGSSSSGGDSGETPAAGSPFDYLVCGTGYGNNIVIDSIDSNSPRIGTNRNSDYPVVVINMLQGDGAWNTSRRLTAPEIYFMSQPTPFTFYDNCYGELISNFVFIGGSSISGMDYRDNASDRGHIPSKLVLKTNPSGGEGIICFGMDCTLTVTGNMFARTVKIPKGYYSFHDGTDLYSLTEENLSTLFTPVETDKLPSYVNTQRVDFIMNNYTTFLDGRSGFWNYSALWTDSRGVLSAGIPSSVNSGKKYTLSSNTVYFHITSCDNWENAFTDAIDGNNNQGVYQSKRIVMRYVNASENFTIPKNKAVIFQADTISLSTDRQDSVTAGGADQRPAIQSPNGSWKTQFILRPLSGSTLQLYVPAAIKVYQNNGQNDQQSYTIEPGNYQIPEMDLLSDDAKDYFSRNKPSDPSSGTSSGSGGGTLTGGVYTDGQQ